MRVQHITIKTPGHDTAAWLHPGGREVPHVLGKPEAPHLSQR